MLLSGKIWQNYIDTIMLAPFHLFYLNSIIVTACVTLGRLLTCAMGAYAFAGLNFKGRDKLFLLYPATFIITFQATMIPVFIIIKKLGWIDSRLSLIILDLFSVYGTFLLCRFFNSLPREPEESVLIDGWIFINNLADTLGKQIITKFERGYFTCQNTELFR